MTIHSSPMTGKAIVLYDGDCPLCCRSVALLGRLDWLGRLCYQNARDVDHLPVSKVPFDPARLLIEMHLLTPDRQRTYAGFSAFRWISGRLPSFWIFWPLLFVPGAPWLGRRLYRWVAKNRFQLVPCSEGTCEVPNRSRPAKAMTGEETTPTTTA